MKNPRRLFTLVLSVLFSLIAFIYVAARLEWRTLRDIFAHLNWMWLTAALLVFIVNYVLRTLRFQALICTHPVPFFGLMGVTCLHGVFNYLMPAKIGEFSYLFLLNRRLRIPVTEGTATLLVARFFDFATIALCLPAVVVTLWQRLPARVAYVALAFCGIVFALGFGSLWLLRRRDETNSTPSQHAETKNRWLNRLLQLWRDLLRGLRSIDRQGQYWHLLLLTAGIWLCVYTNYYFIVLSLGYYPTYFQMVAVSVIMVPLTLLPLQGVANVGTHEAGWVAAFSLFGQSQEVSLAIAAGSHIILLTFVLVIGLVGMISSLAGRVSLSPIESDML